MGVQRQKGVLERICLTKGKAHAYVRVNDALLHVCMVNRGVLQKDGSISLCANGDRYDPLPVSSNVVLDIDPGQKNQTPFVVAWAPK